MTAGYAGTPLAAKLGIKEGMRVCHSGAPRKYADVVAPLPAGVRLTTQVEAATDIVHVFSTRKSQLAKALHDALAKLRPDAVIWVSWPKKSSKMPTDITEDVVREVALPMGLVDVKVCAVDETWSGLKLVVRKELRGARR